LRDLAANPFLLASQYQLAYPVAGTDPLSRQYCALSTVDVGCSLPVS
jgi:hypothetical protein